MCSENKNLTHSKQYAYGSVDIFSAKPQPLVDASGQSRPGEEQFLGVYNRGEQHFERGSEDSPLRPKNVLPASFHKK